MIGAVIVGAGTATIHGSGFLAVYVAGLVISDAWAKQDCTRHAVPEALVGVAEPLLFGLLGAMFAAPVGWDHLWEGVVLTLVTVLPGTPADRVRVPSPDADSRDPRTAARLRRGASKAPSRCCWRAYPALEGLSRSARHRIDRAGRDRASIVVQGCAAGRRPPWAPPDGSESSLDPASILYRSRARESGRLAQR